MLPVLAVVTAAMNMDAYIFSNCFSPDICLGMGLPDHMAALFLFIYFFRRCGMYVQASLVAQMAKNLPAKQEIWV